MTGVNCHFNVIGIRETRIRNANFTSNSTISEYNFEFVSTPLSVGGVGMNIDSNVVYTVIEKNSNDAIQIFKKNEIYCMSNFP